VPDRVKPSFVIFDIRALRNERQSARVSKITNVGLIRSGTAQDALQLYTRMATVGVKGLPEQIFRHFLVVISTIIHLPVFRRVSMSMREKTLNDTSRQR